MEIISFIAIAFLVWMMWQLYRAKQFTQFKRFINEEMSKKVLQHVEEKLTTERSELFPNNDEHIKATQFYWTQYPVRTLQYALNFQLISSEQLKKNGQYRHSQHLFHTQGHWLHQFSNEEELVGSREL